MGRFVSRVSMKQGGRVLVVVCCLWAAQNSVADHAVAVGLGGAVASAVPSATEVGLGVLRAGGNAADAAVATALALAVVMPQAGNLGGGGFAVVRFGDAVRALDFRETAPSEASPRMYLDAQGKPRPGASLIGPLAAGVPGSPAGLYRLHEALGRLAWADVVAPAIRLAREGFNVDPRLTRGLERARGLLQRFPETAAVWLPAGRPPAAGSRKRLPELAATLQAYAEQGPGAITQGGLASAIERAARRHGGVLSAEDLAAYRPIWRDPVQFEAFGWQVASMPLPSSGGIIIGQTLGLLERRGWGSWSRSGADRPHVLAESWRRAFADRVRLGDPTTTDADAADLLAAEWLDRRAAEIDLAQATASPRVAPWSSAAVVESAETTHLSVLDGDGNAVALTTTLNGAFGCGLLVPEAGFFLNNEMDDFATAPGQANLYGLIQGEANAVGPGKRMLSSMSPTIAWRGGDVIVLGSPGGSRIPTATAQVLLGLVVDGDALPAAVARPRIHHQWQPDLLFAEPEALSPAVRQMLAVRGHQIEESLSLGEVLAVMGAADGTMQAVADPRHPGAVGVVRPAGVR